MPLRKFTLMATLAVLPTTTFSEPAFDATVTLGYSSGSSDLTDYDGFTFGLSSELALSHGVSLGADLDFEKLSEDSEDIKLSRIALEPRYTFGSGVVVGGYLQRTRFELDSPVLVANADGHIDSSGLFLGYEAGGLELEAYLGKSETDPALPSEVDIHDYGFRAAFDVSSNLHLAGQYSQSTIDGPGGDIDLDLFSIAGLYSFESGVSIFGAYGVADISDTPLDLETISIGAGYEIKDIGNLPPATLSLELVRTSLDAGGPEEDVDVVRLGVSFPIGSGASRVPLNSSTRWLSGDVRTPIPAAVLASF